MWKTYSNRGIQTAKTIFLPENIAEVKEGQLLQISSVGVRKIHIKNYKPQKPLKP